MQRLDSRLEDLVLIEKISKSGLSVLSLKSGPTILAVSKGHIDKACFKGEIDIDIDVDADIDVDRYFGFFYWVSKSIQVLLDRRWVMKECNLLRVHSRIIFYLLQDDRRTKPHPFGL